MEIHSFIPTIHSELYIHFGRIAADKQGWMVVKATLLTELTKKKKEKREKRRNERENIKKKFSNVHVGF